MKRLTIALSNERHQALNDASVERDRTIARLMEKSLEHYGIKSRVEARALIARAREHGGMTESRAMALATKETKANRKR